MIVYGIVKVITITVVRFVGQLVYQYLVILLTLDLLLYLLIMNFLPLLEISISISFKKSIGRKKNL